MDTTVSKHVGAGFDSIFLSTRIGETTVPMTLTYELGLDILKMYLHTNKSSATAELARDADDVDINVDYLTIKLNPG